MATTKPFSVRFSESIEKVIHSIAGKEGKTASEVIRERMEESVSSEKKFSMSVHELMSNSAETMSDIRKKIFMHAWDRSSETELTIQQISVLMIYWHHAYVNRAGNRFANLNYVGEFLEITKELIEAAKKEKVDIDILFLRTRLGYLDGCVDDVSAINEKKISIENDFNNSGRAERFLRPMEIMAHSMDQFDPETIRKIFTFERLTLLFPVAMKALGQTRDEPFMRDIEDLLPMMASFKIIGFKTNQEKNADITFTISGKPFCLVLCESNAHYSYAFKSDSVLSLLLNLGLIKKEFENKNFHFNFETLSIQGNDEEIHIHEHQAYRLTVSREEFREIINELEKILSGSAAAKWAWLLNRYKMFKGDI